jgi:hypothetical protein
VERAPLLGVHVGDAVSEPAATDRWLKPLVGIMIAVFSFGTAAYARQNSFFIADDYDHFQLAASLPLGELLLTPIDVHFAPLHRALSLLIVTLAPLSFDLALTVMLSLHLAAAFVLYRVLERLGSSPWNPVFVLVCACNSVTLPMFVWWGAGIHRLPYVLLALATLYYYLGFRESRSQRDLWLCMVSFVLAFGFYSKAALIPAYVLAVELCLSWRVGRQRLSRFALGLAMLFMALCYVVWYLKFASVMHSDRSPALAAVGQAVLLFFRVLMNILLLNPFSAGYLPEVVAYLFWAGLFLAVCLRRSENRVVCMALLGVLTLNFLVISVSNRVGFFGAFIPLSGRYYLEVLFLVAIFLRLLVTPVAGSGKRWAIGAALFCLSYPVGAYHVAKQNRSELHRDAQQYMSRLLAGLDALPASQRSLIAKGTLPLYVYGDFLKIHKPFSDILPLRYPSLQFVDRDQAQYEIVQDGSVVRLSPTQ